LNYLYQSAHLCNSLLTIRHQFLNVRESLIGFNSPLPPLRMRLQHLDIFFIFAIHIQEPNIFQYFSMHDIFSSTLWCVDEISCSPILRVTTHTRWCGSVAVICSVEKTSIPITADLALCKECPTRSDGTHTVGMQGNAAAGSYWPLKRLYNHTPLSPPIIINQDLFSRFINLYTAMKMLSTFLFSSV